MKLNYAAYIISQKSRIRAEHESDIGLIFGGQVFTVSNGVEILRDSEVILNEIDGLAGLNMSERAACARIRGAAIQRSESCNIA